MFEIGRMQLAKQRSEEIARGIDEFLARGGKIKYLAGSEMHKDQYHLRNGRHQLEYRQSPSIKWFQSKGDKK